MDNSDTTTFWRPGTRAPGVAEYDREVEGESNVVPFNANANLSIQQQRVRLPVYNSRMQICYGVEKYPVVVVIGQTGCGKTTQIPQYLHEAKWTEGDRCIAITQPRRVAATSVAARVAEEMAVFLGQVVGYSIRFDECTNEETKIKFMTDGMLLRETLSDPLLSKYSVIMLDEAHERTLNTDVLFGLLKKIAKKRPELRIIVSSATVDAEEIKNFFNTNHTKDPSKDNVLIMSIEGRTYPVDIHYLTKPCPDYMEKTLETVMEIHNNQPIGDILIFLTGQDEVETMCELILEKSKSNFHKNNMQLHPIPIYSGLQPQRQAKVFEKLGLKKRKVVVATNIAETSITIDDCGFAKLKSYDPRTRMECLVGAPISQASAKQRSGRAGRSRPGKCYRLYTEENFYEILSKTTTPEIQRANLTMLVLQLKSLGIEDVLKFDFLSKPSSDTLLVALETLHALGAITENTQLTVPLGKQMTEFPIDPSFSKMILMSPNYGCSEEILTIAAMLSVQSVFMSPHNAKHAADAKKRKFAVEEGDHLTLLNVFNAFLENKNNNASRWCQQHYINLKAIARAVDVRKQLKAYAKRFGIKMCSNEDPVSIRKCLVTGFFANAAKMLPNGDYETIKGSRVLAIHPNSVLFSAKPPEFVVFHEIVLTSKEYMREITSIEKNWLTDVAPFYYEWK